MKLAFIAYTAFSLLATCVVAIPAAASPAPLVPAGKWTVDYGDAGCTLARDFGASTNPTTLGFVPSPGSEDIRVVVATPAPFSAESYTKGEVIAEGVPPFSGNLLYVRKTSGSLVSVYLETSGALKAFSHSSVLTLRSTKDSIAFNLGSPTAAFAALDECSSNLLAQWGEDTAIQAKIVTAPVIKNLSVFNDGDYPDVSLRNHEEGMVGVRVWIEPNGRATDCVVVKSSGSKALDARTCSIMTLRGHYIAAVDKGGSPIRALSYTQVFWMLPSD